MSNLAGLVEYANQVNERASERAMKVHTRTTLRMRAADVAVYAQVTDVAAQRGGK
jgi:hypothetical protein